MFRVPVATTLDDDGVLQATLPGGLWPQTDDQASSMSRQDYPAAFDDLGQIRPTLLVQDEGAFNIPVTSKTATYTFRLLVWQQQGRGAIDGALKRAFSLLDGAQLNVGGLWVYEIRWAGDGPSVRDQALGDAEQGWSRWQAIVLR